MVGWNRAVRNEVVCAWLRTGGEASHFVTYCRATEPQRAGVLLCIFERTAHQTWLYLLPRISLFLASFDTRFLRYRQLQAARSCSWPRPGGMLLAALRTL